MKKIVAVGVLMVILAVVLAGCRIGNRDLGIDFTQTFRWAIIDLGNGELIEGEVTAWRDYDESDVVQVTVNGITYLSHYSKIILCTEKP